MLTAYIRNVSNVDIENYASKLLEIINAINVYQSSLKVQQSIIRPNKKYVSGYMLLRIRIGR